MWVVAYVCCLAFNLTNLEMGDAAERWEVWTKVDGRRRNEWNPPKYSSIPRTYRGRGGSTPPADSRGDAR